MKTILLVGNCGSGKTWVMLELLKNLQPKRAKIKQCYFSIDEYKKIAVLGVYDNSMFQGSDRLSMSVSQDFQSLRKSQIQNEFIIIAEGQRFSTKNFIEMFNPLIIKIKDTGEAGRAKRKSSQTERHLKSISTLVKNIKENYLVEDSNQALYLINKIIKNEKNSIN